jgi:glycosyltransferase involved in cell wall biosynthesis
MLQVEKPVSRERRLDRSKWHSPLVSIIITHFNYSNFVQDALLSLLDQTHENWECVVVDDASVGDHLSRLREVVAGIGDPRIRVHARSENRGQVPAFFAGFHNTSGDFVCLLDPDDRYHECFLEESIKIHLNNAVVCPISCTDQFTLTKNGVNTSSLTWMRRTTLQQNEWGSLIDDQSERLFFFPADKVHWFWSSASAMMFRRAAIRHIEPDFELDYKRAGDSFLAQGAHALGGTLFLTKSLVYRQLHENNSFTVEDVYSSFQDRKRPTSPQFHETCKRDIFNILTSRGFVEEAKNLYPHMRQTGSAGRRRRGSGTSDDMTAVEVGMAPAWEGEKDRRLVARLKRSGAKRIALLRALFKA